MRTLSHYRAGLWHQYEKPMYGALLNPYHPLAQGLIGCWLFNEGGGNTVFDLSGYANHGMLGGGTVGYCPSWTVGKFGSALNFDGTDDYVGDLGNFGQPNTLTISMWFKTTSTSWGILFGQTNALPPDTPTAFVPTLTWRSDGYIQGEFYPVNCVYSSSDLSANRWHHATLVGDIDSVYLYIDGELNDSESGSSIDHSWWEYSFIGTGWGDTGRGFPSNDWYYFDGVIPLVCIWERALSESEIWQLYTDPFCMFYHPLEAEVLYAVAPPAGIVPQAMHHYRMMREV